MATNRDYFGVFQLAEVLSTTDGLKKFLKDKKLLADFSDTPCHCGGRLSTIIDSSFSLDKVTWRCNNRACRKKLSIRTGSFFSLCRLPLETALKLIYFWAAGYTVTQCQRECCVAIRTVVEWYNYCRDACIDILDSGRYGQIGGEGVVVEIDERKSGKIKYHKGKKVDEAWVFGGIEKEKKDNNFFVLVEDRSAKTLIPLIEKHVKKGSVIISSGRKAYSSLSSRGYSHQTVHHSKHLVTGAHRNLIQTSWICFKRKFKSTGNKKDFIHGYFAEFIFQRKFGREQPFLAFLDFIASLYSKEKAIAILHSRKPIPAPSPSAVSGTSSTPSTSALPTTSPSTSALPTTSPSTSAHPTTSPSTSALPTTLSSTSADPKTSSSTSALPKTSPTPSTATLPTTSPSTSAHPKTSSSTSALPKTSPSTSALPTTSSSTSALPTTSSSTSALPKTSPSTSAHPKTSSSTSALPTTSSSTSALSKTLPTPSTSALPKTSPTPSTSALPKTSPTPSTSALPKTSPSLSTSALPATLPTSSTSALPTTLQSTSAPPTTLSTQSTITLQSPAPSTSSFSRSLLTPSASTVQSTPPTITGPARLQSINLSSLPVLVNLSNRNSPQIFINSALISSPQVFANSANANISINSANFSSLPLVVDLNSPRPQLQLSSQVPQPRQPQISSQPPQLPKSQLSVHHPPEIRQPQLSFPRLPQIRQPPKLHKPALVSRPRLRQSHLSSHPPQLRKPQLFKPSSTSIIPPSLSTNGGPTQFATPPPAKKQKISAVV